MPYGQRWREHRKLIYTHMSKTTVQGYAPAIERETKQFLARLVQRPERFMADYRL